MAIQKKSLTGDMKASAPSTTTAKTTKVPAAAQPVALSKNLASSRAVLSKTVASRAMLSKTVASRAVLSKKVASRAVSSF